MFTTMMRAHRMREDHTMKLMKMHENHMIKFNQMHENRTPFNEFEYNEIKMHEDRKMKLWASAAVLAGADI